MSYQTTDAPRPATELGDDREGNPPVTRPSDSERAPARSGLLSKASSAVLESSVTLVAFLAVLIAMVIWLGGRFANAQARLLDVHQTVPVLLVGMAALVTLIAGALDLSIASMATLSAYLVIGLTYKSGWPFWAVLLVCLGVGVLGGLVNGFIVEILHVNALIATLATGSVFLGASAVYSDGTGISSNGKGTALPSWFRSLGQYNSAMPAWLTSALLVLAAAAIFLALKRLQPVTTADRTWVMARTAAVAALALIAVFVLNVTGWVGHVSWATGLLLLAATVLWALLDFTTFGRGLRASGANRVAARLAGVKVRRQVMTSFVLAGALASLAGAVLAASTASASPNMAGGFLLPAFTAAFLSTVILSAGRFTVWGVVIGGTFVVWISQGLIIGGLDFTWTDVVNGSILVVAVALSTFRRRQRQ